MERNVGIISLRYHITCFEVICKENKNAKFVIFFLDSE